MYQPEAYGIALLFMIISMMCWGSWANTMKLTPGWPFQLFYWDYIVGIIIGSLLWGLTLGSAGGGQLSFLNNIRSADSQHIIFALLGGVVFNVANLLLVAAIEIAGLAVAFPVGIGLALVVGVLLNYFIAPQGSPLLLFGGVVLVVVAIIIDALAYRRRETTRKAECPGNSTQCSVRNSNGSVLSSRGQSNHRRTCPGTIRSGILFRPGNCTLRSSSELLLDAQALDRGQPRQHERLFSRTRRLAFVGNCRWRDLVHGSRV